MSLPFEPAYFIPIPRTGINSTKYGERSTDFLQEIWAGHPGEEMHNIALQLFIENMSAASCESRNPDIRKTGLWIFSIRFACPGD